MGSTAIRPLRTALIAALKGAETSAEDRVFTPPVAQEASFPRLVLDAYTEDPAHFFGRSGSWVRCQVKGQAQSTAGDAPREALWQETHAALDGVAIPVQDHLLLQGNLRRIATYLDPDGVTLHFIGLYEAETKVA